MATAALCLASVAIPTHAQVAGPTPIVAEESALKAAFLYNFLLLTKWPGEAHSGVTICALGRDTLGPALEALEKKSPGGRYLKTLRLDDASISPKACQLLYLGSARTPTARELLSKAEHHPVLTVADDDTSVGPAPLIVLERDGGRLAFDIRISPARARGLELDPKLLRLARQVK